MPSAVKLTAQMAFLRMLPTRAIDVVENPYESTQGHRGKLSQGRSAAANVLRSMLFGASTISLMFALLMLIVCGISFVLGLFMPGLRCWYGGAC